LQAAAKQLRVGASDQRLASELQQNPSIAGLRRPDGSLDMERYRQLLGSQGMTPESFESQVRADLAARQVMLGVGGTSFAPTSLADVTVNAFYEQRQVQIARFVATDFVSKVTLSDAQLQDYYKAHAERFQSAEQADVSYVMLDLASVQKGIVVPEAELKTYYEQNLSRLSALEERRVSHILISADKSAPSADATRREAKRKNCWLLFNNPLINLPNWRVKIRKILALPPRVATWTFLHVVPWSRHLKMWFSP